MARPIGIHLSYWQTNWSQNVAPFIQKAKQAGFDGAEFPLLSPFEIDFPFWRAALDEHNMRATCGTGLNPQVDITSPDRDIRAAGIRYLEACLNGAAVLGSPVLGGLTYAPWGYFPQGDHSVYRCNCIESLKQVAEIAEKNQVTLCLEVVNRFEGYLINTVQQGLELLQEVNSPFVRLHLDTFHLNIEEDQIAPAIRLAANQLGHFHCCENNRKRPGLGHIPWLEVRQALDSVQYQGWLVVESFVNPAGEVGRDLFIWRTLSDVLDEDATNAAEFLRKEVSGV